ncbi:MAG TPA: tetratricopeptide repeat protein [Bryobacteraceae bacterium]|nr:tetratricopeptide repeat protein [Bryobacteraceae bacterium]
MTWHRILFAVLPVLLATASLGQQLPAGFEHFYNLEYDEAINYFRKEVADQPNNPEAHNHLAQAMLYRDMYRAGALESELVSRGNSFLRRKNMEISPENAKIFNDSISKSISLSEARIAKNPKDVRALYAAGVAHGLRANYNFLVRKAWVDALKDAGTGRKYHNRITEIDPNFMDARLMQGLHDYVIGSLPTFYKMLGFVAGFRGDKEVGIKTVQLVAEKGDTNRYDAQVLLSVIHRREKKSDKAIPILKGLVDRFPRNYLLRLELAQMYGDTGNKEQALAIFRAVEDLKMRNAPGYANLPMEKIYFYRGTLLFWYNDLDQALDQMRRVTPKAKELDLNTALMSWMRVGQILDLKGDRKQALEAYRQAIALAPESEAAKESKGYLSSPYKRT